MSKGSDVGDNYLGVLYRVQVAEGGKAEGEADGEGSKPAMSLIFKAMPASAKRREALRVVDFFVNEYTMYKSILPAYADFLVDKGLLKEKSHYPYTPR